ncbi:MAG: lipopolysaccharide biosynthesis protein, partial [Oscillospiraceae bacterium]|nr:lipopolysaccharide biosynthesis protein [Oscillospiraceae bacterium]
MGNNKYRTLAGNMLILTIGQFSSKLLVYIMLKFYTSMLGTAEFGTMNIIVSTAGLLISVATLSIADGVLRFALEKNNNGKMVYSIGINICIAGCAVFVLFVPLIGMVPMLKGYEWLMFVYVITGSIKEVSGIYVRCRYSSGVKLFAVDGIITTISTILFNLLFLGVFKWGASGYMWAVIMGDITSLVFLNATAKLFTQYHPFRNDKTLRNSMLRYSIPLMPTMIMWAIINNSDMYMVEGFISAEANSIYSFAYKFPNLVTIVVGIFAQAWRMTAITERNSRKTSMFYSNTLSMQQTVMFLTCGGIMLILRPLIIPFLGHEEFSSAFFYVPTLLFATIFQAMDNFLSSIYEAARKTSHAMISSCIGAAANILLNLILIPIPQ